MNALRRFYPLILGGAAIVLAVAWLFSVRNVLFAAIIAQEKRTVEESVALFDHQVTHLKERSRAECWLMAEDPRLRTVLTTTNMDEGTIVDLLGDLQRLTESPLLAVLTPEGVAHAVVGRPSLRGQDLSSSKLVIEARSSETPITGAWVLDEQLTFVSNYAIRFGDRIVAYLLVGRPIDAKTLTSLYDTTRTSLAVFVSGQMREAVPSDAAEKTRLGLAFGNGEGVAILKDEVGDTFLGKTRVIEGVRPSAHLVWARSVGDTLPEFDLVLKLLWVIPIAAVAFFILQMRNTPRS